MINKHELIKAINWFNRIAENAQKKFRLRFSTITINEAGNDMKYKGGPPGESGYYSLPEEVILNGQPYAIYINSDIHFRGFCGSIEELQFSRRQYRIHNRQFQVLEKFNLLLIPLGDGILRNRDFLGLEKETFKTYRKENATHGG